MASYSMLIGGTWTASIHDKRTHSSMYSVNFTQFCNSGKSYKVLHSCLLTSFKAKKKRNVKNLLMKLYATFVTHVRNDGFEPACPAVEIFYSVHIEKQLF